MRLDALHRGVLGAPGGAGGVADRDDAVRRGSAEGGSPDEDGLTLSVLCRLRAPLTDEEAAGVVAGLADAVALARRDGHPCGMIGPDDVVVRADGSVALAARHTSDDGTPEDTLRSLVVTVLAVMPDAVLDRLGREDADTTVREELERAVARPDVTAAELVRACRRAAAAEPVRWPDRAVLARVQLVPTGGRSARDDDDGEVAAGSLRLVRSERRRRCRPGGRRSRGGRRKRRGERVRGGWPRRAGRLGRVPWVLGAGATVVLLAAVVFGGSLRPTDDPRRGTSAPGAEADPVTAAVALTEHRALLVGRGDPVALAEVDVPGGPAYEADRALLSGLMDRRVEGLHAQVLDAWPAGPDASVGGPGPAGEQSSVVDRLRRDVAAATGDGTGVVTATEVGAPTGTQTSTGTGTSSGVGAPTGTGAGTVTGAGTAWVAVRVVMSGHTRAEPDGTVATVPPSSPRTVVLGLRATRDGWRVWEVADGPPG